MKSRIKLISIGILKTHEEISLKRRNMLVEIIKKDGYLKKPVVADKKTYTVLDGHHRLAALKKLGCRKIPVYFVNYFDKDLKVYLRRKKLAMMILKEAVLKKAADGQLFPYKTTRHYLQQRPKIKIILQELLREET